MSFSYYLLVATFLVFPIIALLFAKQMRRTLVGSVLRYSFSFFLLYDLARYFGYSIKGDLPDYIILGIQYLWFCTLVFFIQWQAIWHKMLKVAGCLLIGFGCFIGFMGIAFFILFADGMDSDRQYYIAKENDKYEIRRFPGNGFDAVFNSYNFDVYKEMGVFEYYTSSFRLTSDFQTPFDLDTGLQFNIVNYSKVSHLVMKDKNGRQHTEQLK